MHPAFDCINVNFKRNASNLALKYLVCCNFLETYYILRNMEIGEEMNRNKYGLLISTLGFISICIGTLYPLGYIDKIYSNTALILGSGLIFLGILIRPTIK